MHGHLNVKNLNSGVFYKCKLRITRESFYFSAIFKGQKVISPGIKYTSCTGYNLGFYAM